MSVTYLDSILGVLSGACNLSLTLRRQSSLAGLFVADAGEREADHGLEGVGGVVACVVEVPACHAELQEDAPETHVLAFLFQGFVHVGCVDCFEDVGEIADVVADVAHEGDVGLDVVAY